MPHPLRPLLPGLAPALDGLVTAAAWRGIEELAARLPPVWSWAGFEVRLGAEESQVDFALYALEVDGGRQALAGWVRGGEELPEGSSVQPLLEEWSRPEGGLADVPNLWLEYDFPDGIPRAPTIGLTFASGEGVSPLRLRTVSERALRSLPGRQDDSQGLDLLDQASRRLPPGARILHLGILAPWRRQAMRLTALLPSAAALRTWLEDIGRPPDPCVWEAGLELMGTAGGAFQIGLDLSADGEPRLALDWPWLVSPAAEEIARLAERGLCDPDKARVLRSWIGDELVRMPGTRWPLRIDRQLGFKVVIGAGGRAEAKAYLAFRPRCVLF
ncbi:MAG TPA: hypothetical protein VE078_09645 [Thermoanaerobaculia bacterium]|nr:hypothetical protein [Thermoanaerobaculia bacterium]